MKNLNEQQMTDACNDKLKAINERLTLELLLLTDMAHDLQHAFNARFPYEPHTKYGINWNIDEEMTAQSYLNAVEDDIERTGQKIQGMVAVANETQNPVGVWDAITMEIESLHKPYMELLTMLTK